MTEYLAAGGGTTIDRGRRALHPHGQFPGQVVSLMLAFLLPDAARA